NPDLHNPYNMTWNLNLQYQLKDNYLVQLTYDGSASVGNLETPQYNALPPDFFVNNPSLLTPFLGNNQLDRPFQNYGTITYRGNISHSTYHGGTVHFNKRYSGGLTLDAFY